MNLSASSLMGCSRGLSLSAACLGSSAPVGAASGFVVVSWSFGESVFIIPSLVWCYNRPMTNEEIEKRASEAFAKSLQAAHRGDESEIVGNIAEVIREAVSQAYEEAARTLELMALDYEAREREWRANPLHIRPSARGACLSGASEIRALKDPLPTQLDRRPQRSCRERRILLQVRGASSC
jgi:hypothetical protein